MATLERSESVSVSSLLSEDLIGAELEASSRTDVFEDLLDLLNDAEKINEVETALSDIEEREEILSTGIGDGVAIPHAKTSAVDSLVAAFGRVPDGVDFKSLDGKPARLIFLLLSPQNEAGMHVRALARISRMLKNVNFREKMLEANDAEEIFEIISSEEIR